MKAKYIIIKHDEKEVPLVFSAFLKHDDIVAKKKIISAGFCKLNDTGKWIVGGHSVSLKLGARPHDAEILDAHL